MIKEHARELRQLTEVVESYEADIASLRSQVDVAESAKGDLENRLVIAESKGEETEQLRSQVRAANKKLEDLKKVMGNTKERKSDAEAMVGELTRTVASLKGKLQTAGAAQSTAEKAAEREMSLREDATDETQHAYRKVRKAVKAERRLRAAEVEGLKNAVKISDGALEASIMDSLKFEVQRDRANAKVDQLTEQVRDLTQERDTLRGIEAWAYAIVEQMGAQNETLTQSESALRDRASRLETDLQEWKELAASYASEAAELRSQLTLTLMEKEDLEQRLASGETGDKVQLRKDLHAANEKLNNLQTRMKKLEEKNIELQEKGKSMERAKAKIEQGLQKSEKGRAAAEAGEKAEKVLVRDATSDANRAYEKLEKSAEREARLLSELERRPAEIQMLIEDLGDEIAKLHGEIARGKAAHESEKEYAAKILKAKGELTTKYSTVQADLEASLQETVDERRKLVEKDTELRQRITELGSEKLARKGIEGERDKARRELEASRATVAQFQAQYSELEGELRRAKATLEERRVDLSNANSQVLQKDGLLLSEQEARVRAEQSLTQVRETTVPKEQFDAVKAELDAYKLKERKENFRKELAVAIKKVPAFANRTEVGIDAAIRRVLDNPLSNEYFGREPDWSRPVGEIPKIIKHISDVKIFE